MSPAPVAQSRRDLLKGQSRRDLLKGALLVGFVLPLLGGKARAANAIRQGYDPADDSAPPAAFAPGGFVRIDEHGVRLIMLNVEMGQGIYTAEATLIAEELEVGLDQITLEAAPPDDRFYIQPLLKIQATGGSTSVRGAWEPLRRAGASARVMLVGAAAAQWGVDPATCTVQRGVVTHGPSGRSLPYTALAAAASQQPEPKTVTLKDPAQFTLIGKSQKRLDTPGKVDGSAQFGIDVRVPGMKIATVAACPTLGGTLVQVDPAPAMAIQGVRQVVKIANAVAVVGDTMWAAKQGLAALSIEWNPGPNAALSTDDIHQQLVAASTQGTPIVARHDGDTHAAINGASKTVEATYNLPFLSHAPMEPINTLLHIRPDGADIWVGTQVPGRARDIVAQVAGLPKEKVFLHNQLIGGGFGRRLEADSVLQAAEIAKQVDFPVKIIWTREEDIQHDWYRPMYHDRVAAGLNAAGMPVAWWHRVTSGTVLAHFVPAAMPHRDSLDNDTVEGASELPYDMPQMLVEWVRQDPPEHVPISWWRGVGPAHNVFVVESFLDELAHTAGIDPLAYRRALLAKNPRARAVLELATDKAGWGQPLGPRIGQGISLHDSFGSYLAVVVETEVSPQGEVRLRRAVAAVDCGMTINPDTVAAQIEGGLIFGLSAALYSGIQIQNGRVTQSNFNDYRILRINEAPHIEVHHIQSAEPPGGIGEAATVSAFPALGNAIFAATGIRLRDLPFDRTLLRMQGSDRSQIAMASPAGLIAVATLAERMTGPSAAAPEQAQP
ncbi:MAG: xanthine dehydrogenase family protein molybdopterin-binding subunit [Acetobacteraceae bacterium]